jgi:Ca2+-binding RTX toxin-like protein
MPEGFYVNSFSLGTLPAGVVILDKNGNEITGTTISKEDMILKDALGNIIDFNDADFIEKFKSIEFTIKYTEPDSLPSQFDIAITANYELSSAYSDTTDLAPNQTYTNTYTFALKDITSANDYTYKQSDYASGQAEGFILAKEPNYNIIKDGSGDNTIYGSIGKDVIYDATGDDTVYLSGGSDTLYAGAGTNIINGDTYIAQDDSLYTYNDGRDKVSYENVQSFSLAELEFLKTQNKLTNEEYEKLTSGTGTLLDDMTNYYKGVYVDLNGISELAVDIDGDGTLEDIHSLSKFALKDANSFTYDADGNIISTTITQSGLSNLQNIGQDNLSNIEDIDGSNYNDTIYGNSSSNILSGLGGSDILDGREGGNTLYGGSGYDTLLSGTGNDTIHGGDDTDTVSYINSSTGVVVRLDKPNGDEYDDFATGHGTDILISIEDVIGSNQTDTIFGSGGTNYIMAMGGDDSIFAGKGYDFIDGGTGNDWLSYYIPDYDKRVDNPNYMEDIQGITVSMGTDFVMLKETSTGRLIDLIKDIEQVRGTYGVDTIWGDASNEVFWGHEGNDDLRGNGGNDTLYGGAGNDYIRPGAGLDTSYGDEGVDYLELYDDGVVANQRLRLDGNGNVQRSTDTTNGTDGTWTDGYNANGGINLAYGFEGYSGGNSDDTLYGNTHNNVINGHNGDDKIYGLGGNDTLNGGNGNDLLDGGEGNDTLNGANGNDTLNGSNGDDFFIGSIRYDTSTDADAYNGGDGVDTLDYSITNHNYTMAVTFSGVGAGTITFGGLAANTTNYQDTFANMERLITSRANDVINASADTTGMYLDGMGGTDTITGGSGNDTIIARNTAGETLNGGGGTDTLQLAQNVDFRNQAISNFETLDLGSTTATFNASQLPLNSFSTITGASNSRINIYGTTGNDNIDFGSMDFSGFSGAIYTYANNGNDTIDLTHVSDIDDIYFYLDAGGNTDTLKLGNNQTLKLLDNTYNTFEDFDIEAGSTLEVSAYNDTNRTFNAYNNKDFSGVAGEINFIGKNGNDTFQLDFTALDSGKFTVEGGAGTDTVDIRNVTGAISFDSADASMFSNIEQLRLSSISNSHNITLSAEALANWSSGNSLTLDLSNNTQGTKVTITDSVGADITNLTIGSSYSITSDTGDTLNLSVV